MLACLDTMLPVPDMCFGLCYSCVTPWLPDHTASQPELPPEVLALHGLAAAVHSQCMANDRFMAAIQQEAAGMTAKQVEQVQVCDLCTNQLRSCYGMTAVHAQTTQLQLSVNWGLAQPPAQM